MGNVIVSVDWVDFDCNVKWMLSGEGIEPGNKYGCLLISDTTYAFCVFS